MIPRILALNSLAGWNMQHLPLEVPQKSEAYRLGVARAFNLSEN
jgi:hypothetical protein